MTEQAWASLVASGRQAEAQALELLRQPLRPWELGTLQETW